MTCLQLGAVGGSGTVGTVGGRSPAHEMIAACQMCQLHVVLTDECHNDCAAAAAAPAEEDNEEVDATGLEAKDIELVMTQVTV